MSSVVEKLLNECRPVTAKAYMSDVKDFSKWSGEDRLDNMLRRLIKAGHMRANAIVNEYIDSMKARGLATKTVNRRLSSLHTLTKIAKRNGLIKWSIDVPFVTVINKHDMLGPSVDVATKMLKVADARDDIAGYRDAAIIRLLFDMALRRAEVASLDFSHINWSTRKILVLGKGTAKRVEVSVPKESCKSLERWANKHPIQNGPLFISLSGNKWGHRISTTGIYLIVRHYGDLCGEHVRPSGLRHSSITRALDVTNGDVRRVQQFSRHKQTSSVLIYDDARKDFAGEISELVALKGTP